MDNSAYEVLREDYVHFLDTIKPEARRLEEVEKDNYLTVNTYSKTYGTLLCSRVIPKDGIAQYYIFAMPQKEDARQPKAYQQITLETKEEVNAFFDIINKAFKKEDKHD